MSLILKLRFTLLEELLGTKAANKDLLDTHVLKSARDVDPDLAAEELESAAHMEDSSTNLFDMVFDDPADTLLLAEQHKAWSLKDTAALKVLNPQVLAARRRGRPIMWDYQIKGFFKDAAGALRTIKGTKSADRKAYKKLIDGLVFPAPRRIPFVLPPGGYVGICERPLRAETPQGPRVALARSETVPEGTTMDVQITLVDPDLLPWITELLDYGMLRGLGQWRNSGKGRFSYSVIGQE